MEQLAIRSYKQRLHNRLNELNDNLRDIESLLDAPKDKDFSDGAIEHEDDEVLEIRGTAGLKEIQAIQSALDRIENGTYGTCLTCGNTISAKRLDLIPVATECRFCMSD